MNKIKTVSCLPRVKPRVNQPTTYNLYSRTSFLHVSEALMYNPTLSVFQHLFEIRNRVLYLLFSLLITFLTSLYYSFDLIYIFVCPFFAPKNFIFTDLTEAFSINIKICFIFSSFFLVPLLFYQIWSFIIPSLYKKERKKITFFFSFSYFLFFFGGVIIYFFLLPEIYKFLFTFEIKKQMITIQLEARIFSYVKFTLYIFFLFFLLFQMPVIFTLLFVLNFIAPNKLSEFRKFYYLSFLIFASFISPPDIVSQVILMFLFFFIFEMNLWFGFLYAITNKKKLNIVSMD